MESGAQRFAVGIAVVLALVAPLPLGGVMPRAAPLLGLLAAAGLAAAVIARRPGLPPRSLGVLAVLTALLGYVYLIPLPPPAVEALSPRLAAEARTSLAFPGEPAELAAAEAALLDRASVAREDAGWRPLAVDPDGAREGAVRLSLAVAAFLLGLFAAGEERSRRLLVWAIAATAGLQAAIGLAEQIAGGGSLLGLQRSFEFTIPTGTFVNPNHFAALLSLGLFALVGLISSRADEPVFGESTARGRAGRRAVLATGLAIVVVAMMWSASRGALSSAAVGMLLFALHASWRAAREKMGVFGPLALTALALALVTASFFARPPERLLEKLGTIDVAIPGRGEIYRMTLAMAQEFPVAGTGIGTFRYAEPLFRDPEISVRFIHAHCDWLQWIAETGALGAPLLLAWIVALVVSITAVLRAPRERALAAALAAGVFALGAHAFVDFPLQLPGVTITGALLAGALLGPLAHGPRDSHAAGRGKRTWGAAPIAVVLTTGAIAALALFASRPMSLPGWSTSVAPWARPAEKVRAVARRNVTTTIEDLQSGAIDMAQARPRIARALAGLRAAAVRAPLRADLRLSLFAAGQAQAGLDLPATPPPPGFEDLQRHYLTRAEALDPASRARRLVLMRSWIEVGDLDEALRLARRLLADEPALAAQVYAELGGADLDLGWLMAATPNTPEAAVALARTMRGRRDLAGAEIVLERARVRHPEDVTLAVELAETLTARKRPADALAILERGALPAEDSLRRRWLRARAAALAASDRLGEVDGVLLEQEASGEGPYVVALQRAQAQIAAKEPDAAIATLREALARRDPPMQAREKVSLLVLLGTTLEREGRVREALETFRQAERLQPDHPGVRAFFERLQRIR